MPPESPVGRHGRVTANEKLPVGFVKSVSGRGSFANLLHYGFSPRRIRSYICGTARKKNC